MISYHIKAAFRNLFRHISVTLMSITAVTITLILIALVSVLTMNLSAVTSTIASDVRIQATVDTTVDETTIQKIQEKIQAIPAVAKVEFFTKHQELDKFIAASNNGEEVYGQYRGDQNPLRDTFYVELASTNNTDSNAQKANLQAVQKELLSIEGIVEAEYGGAVVENLVVILSRIRIVGYIVGLILGVLAVLLIQNTIKSTIHSRKDEIAIMRNVGASNAFVKIPFMIEGILIGVFGSILPIVTLFLAYDPIYKMIADMRIFTLIPTSPFVYQLSLLLIALGSLVGLIGSLISVNKYLRYKR